MNALHSDVEIQRRGMAYVIYELLATSARIPKYMMQCLPKMYLIDAIPVRWVSFHYCFDNPIMKYTMTVLKGALISTSRQRFRSHFGKSRLCFARFFKDVMMRWRNSAFSTQDV